MAETSAKALKAALETIRRQADERRMSSLRLTDQLYCTSILRRRTSHLQVVSVPQRHIIAEMVCLSQSGNAADTVFDSYVRQARRNPVNHPAQQELCRIIRHLGSGMMTISAKPVGVGAVLQLWISTGDAGLARSRPASPILAPHGAPCARESPVEIGCCANQRQLRKRLGK